MKLRIDLAKLIDYDYYSRNLLRIQGAQGLMRFDYTSRFVQKKINDKWEEVVKQNRPVQFIILKARRHGVSTYVQSRMFHGCHTKSHMQGITIAADDEGCEYIHGMSQIYYEYLPNELKPQTKYKSKSRLVFDLPKTTLDKLGGVNIGLKSTMKTVSCNNKAGLGTGNHFIHFSEYASYRDAEGVRKALIPTAFNVPGTFVIIESTANGLVGAGAPFYEEWQKAKAGDSPFEPLFFSWLEHEGYRMPLPVSEAEFIDAMDEEEKELRDKYHATYEQLQWRRNQIGMLGSVEGSQKNGLENFHEQYPTTDDEAFIVSGRNVFDRNRLKTYKQHCEPYKWRGDLYGGKFNRDAGGELKIWEWPIQNEIYIIGIDPASGEPGATDFGCMQVFRVGDRRKGLWGVQVAEWHGKVDAAILGQSAVTLGKMFGNAMLVPEIYGYGDAVLAEILKNNYWNVYKRKQRGVIPQPGHLYGWRTDMTSKKTITTLGRHIINQGFVWLNSEALVDEMMIFVRDSTSERMSAYGRGKDDRVMAFLITMQAIDEEYGDNAIDSIGIVQPNKEINYINRDPLLYDDYWEKNPKGKKRISGWENL